MIGDKTILCCNWILKVYFCIVYKQLYQPLSVHSAVENYEVYRRWINDHKTTFFVRWFKICYKSFESNPYFWSPSKRLPQYTIYRQRDSTIDRVAFRVFSGLCTSDDDVASPIESTTDNLFLVSFSSLNFTRDNSDSIVFRRRRIRNREERSKWMVEWSSPHDSVFYYGIWQRQDVFIILIYQKALAVFACLWPFVNTIRLSTNVRIPRRLRSNPNNSDRISDHYVATFGPSVHSAIGSISKR